MTLASIDTTTEAEIQKMDGDETFDGIEDASEVTKYITVVFYSRSPNKQKKPKIVNADPFECQYIHILETTQASSSEKYCEELRTLISKLRIRLN
jgi:hypothetical protein